MKKIRFICITSNSNIKRNLQGTILESLDWLLKWNTLVELRHDGVKSFLSKHHKIVARILNLQILRTFGDFICAYVNNNIHFHKNKKKSYFRMNLWGFLPYQTNKDCSTFLGDFLVSVGSFFGFNPCLFGRAAILVILSLHFGRNNDLMKSFWI